MEFRHFTSFTTGESGRVVSESEIHQMLRILRGLLMDLGDWDASQQSIFVATIPVCPVEVAL
jgi:hypothetical protein